MAVISWSNFNNGDSYSSIRTKLNNLGTSVSSQVNTNTTNITNLTSQQSTNTSAISTLTSQQSTNTSNISTHETRLDNIDNVFNKFATLLGMYSTPLAYSLTTTYQDVANYTSSGSDGVSLSTSNGTITPSTTGYYRVSFFMSATTTLSSQHIATVGLYDSVDGTLMEGSIPYIDSTGLDVSFTGIFPLTSGRDYKVQIKGTTTGSISVTAVNFSVDLVGV